MNRPSRDAFWFSIAAAYAARATCPRASVGCVIVKLDRMVSAGFNGAPDRQEHCPDTPEHHALEHCTRAWHAERNAIRNAFVPLNDATAYVVGPRRVCVDCEDRLRMAGVTDIRHRYSVPSLDGLARDIRAWQAATFPRATPVSVAEHLRREAEELAGEPSNPEEMADIFHLLVAAAAANGYDLVDVVATKFAVNQARAWGAPDAHGVVEHLRVGRPT